VPAVGFLARCQRRELLTDARDRLDSGELVREGIDARVA
jgi:hypothetical protein